MTKKEFEANEAGYEAGYEAGRRACEAELNHALEARDRYCDALQKLLAIISEVTRVPLEGSSESESREEGR